MCIAPNTTSEYSEYELCPKLLGKGPSVATAPLSAAARTAVGKECLPSPLSIADERNNSVDVGTAFSFEKSRQLGREGGRGSRYANGIIPARQSVSFLRREMLLNHVAGLSTDIFCYSGGRLSLGREPSGESRGLIDLMKDKASIVPLSLTILSYISFTTHDPNLWIQLVRC